MSEVGTKNGSPAPEPGESAGLARGGAAKASEEVEGASAEPPGSLMQEKHDTQKICAAALCDLHQMITLHLQEILSAVKVDPETSNMVTACLDKLGTYQKSHDVVKRRVAARIRRYTLEDAVVILTLPDAPNRVGAPRGPRVFDLGVFDELSRRVGNGERQISVAREIIARTFAGDAGDDRARYLLKRWRHHVRG